MKAREASKKEELDRSRQKIRVVAKKVKLGAQVAVNMHAIGTSFVKKMRDARWITSEWSGEEKPEDMVEFEAQVAGHGTGAQAAFRSLLELPDGKLAAKLGKVRPILLVSASWWSQCTQSMVPEFEIARWWQKPAAEMQCVEC